MNIKRGTRVKLAAAEGNPVEYGTALDSPKNGAVPVRLDNQYFDDFDDDGLRDVPIEQVEVVGAETV